MGVNFAGLPVYIANTEVGSACTKDGSLVLDIDPDMLTHIQEMVALGFIEAIRIGLHEKKLSEDK